MHLQWLGEKKVQPIFPHGDLAMGKERVKKQETPSTNPKYCVFFCHPGDDEPTSQEGKQQKIYIDLGKLL